MAITMALALSLTGITGVGAASARTQSPLTSLQAAIAPTLATAVKAPTPKLTNRTSTQVKVSWKKTYGIRSFEIRVGSKTYKTTKTSLKVKATTNTSVKIRGVRSNGLKSSWSKTIYVQPPTLAKPVIAKKDGMRTTISWKKTSGASRYEIKVGSKIYKTTRTSMTANVQSNHAVQVRAVGKKKQKGSWSSRTYRTPVKVTSLKVRADSASWATVSWTKVPGATEYEVRINNTIGYAWSNKEVLYVEAGDKVSVRALVGRKAGPWSATVTKKLNLDQYDDLLDEKDYYQNEIAECRQTIQEFEELILDYEYERDRALRFGNYSDVEFYSTLISDYLEMIEDYKGYITDYTQELTEINALLKIGT